MEGEEKDKIANESSTTEGCDGNSGTEGCDITTAEGGDLAHITSTDA